MKKKNQTSATNRYLLAGLSLFCILMMVFSSFSDKVSGPFKVLADYTVIPLQQGINHVGGWLGDLSDNFETLQQLRAENEKLQEQVDSLVVIPNDRIREVIDLKKASMKQAFEEADNVLKQGISSISNLISTSGYVNLDFEDLCSVIRNAGLAHMGMGAASGEDMAEKAAAMAISSPLLDTSIEGAKAVIVNITASPDMLFSDADHVSQMIQQAVDEEAIIFWGVVYDETMDNEMRVTVIATGFDSEYGPVLAGDQRAKPDAASTGASKPADKPADRKPAFDTAPASSRKEPAQQQSASAESNVDDLDFDSLLSIFNK